MINYLICFATVNKTVVSFYHSSLKSYFFSCGWPSYNPGHVKVRMCFSHVLLPITVPQLNSSTTKKILSVILKYIHFTCLSTFYLCTIKNVPYHYFVAITFCNCIYGRDEVSLNYTTSILIYFQILQPKCWNKV